MNTYTTPTGIKVLLPQVPIDAEQILVDTYAIPYLTYRCLAVARAIGLPVNNKYTIIGTCWREGGKLICDFDPAQLVDPVIERAYGESYLDYSPEFYPGKSGFVGTAIESWDSWLLSIGEKIKEGHKIVVIKVE